MRETTSTLFADYMPHGHCYRWEPAILGLNVASDALIALAYFSIPGVLWFFVRRRPDLPFARVFFMFGVFIVACGVTHVFSVWNVWHGHYGAAGLAKAFTAAVSVATAIVVLRLLPQALKIKGPAELERSVKEKEVLLREIHHRVKNNLQIVSGLLQLQTAMAPDSEAAQPLRESRDRVHSIALVHEHLYRSDDLASVDLGRYLRELLGYLVGAHEGSGRIRLDLQVPETAQVSIDRAVPLGLVVNELVTNALKHGFPDGRTGTVTVRYEPGERPVLDVADDGVGMAEAPAGDTLGMQIVETLARQLGGRLVRPAVAAGTRFSLELAGNEA